MFDSIKHWFESLTEESKLFDHRDDEILHSALASVLYHVINADDRVDAKEKHEFDRILKQEFDLTQDQVDHLFAAAKGSTADLHGDLHTINFYLKHNPSIRMHFMQKLLQLVDVHGAHEGELAVFFEALHEVFPEVKDLGKDSF